MALRFLRADEDEIDDDLFRMATGIECACCCQEVEASEEAALLLIVQTQQVGDRIEHYPVLKDSDGDYQFTPLFVHLEGCWKDVEEGIQEKIEDNLPVEDAWSILTCRFCGSGVREWEYLALGQFGEFHCSPHQPNPHTPVYKFQPWEGQDETSIRICLSCITKIGEETLDDWGEVSQFGECIYCTHGRCWRDPTCSCFCHQE